MATHVHIMSCNRKTAITIMYTDNNNTNLDVAIFKVDNTAVQFQSPIPLIIVAGFLPKPLVIFIASVKHCLTEMINLFHHFC